MIATCYRPDPSQSSSLPGPSSFKQPRWFKLRLVIAPTSAQQRPMARKRPNKKAQSGGQHPTPEMVTASDPKTKQPVTAQTAIAVQTGFPAGVKLCDALMMPTAGRQSPGRALLSGTEERNVPGIKYTPPVSSRCGAALAALCGAAQRKGQVECGVCLGEHETRLQVRENASFCAILV